MDPIQPIEPRPTWIPPIARERPEQGARERREQAAREERERRARRRPPPTAGRSEDEAGEGGHGHVDVRA